MTVRYDPNTDYIQCLLNNEWKNWKRAHLQALYLYQEGIECTDITGGWVAKSKAYHNSQFAPTVPTMIKNENDIYFKMTSGSFKSGTICTNNKIDVTDYSVIGIRCTGTALGAESAVICLALFSGFTAYSDRVAEASLVYSGVSPNNQIKELDISKVVGAYYIGLFGYTSMASGTIDCNMFELYLR